MSSEERDLVRALVDEAVRARIAIEDARFKSSCKGCGMSMTNWTPGCSNCSDRHNKWRKRGSSDYSPLLHRAVLRFSENNGRVARDAIFQTDESRAMRRRIMDEMQRDGRIGTWSSHRQALGSAA